MFRQTYKVSWERRQHVAKSSCSRSYAKSDVPAVENADIPLIGKVNCCINCLMTLYL